MENISDQQILQALKKTQEEFRFPDAKLELISEECFPDMFKALKECFLTDEPLEKSLEMSWSSDVEDLWLSALRYRMSLMVVNENNGDIMGMRVIRVTKQSDHFNIDEIKDEKVRKIVDFFEYSSENFNFFAKYSISEMFEFFGLGVMPKYRRHGLGTLLVETGVKFLCNLQKPCYIKGSASSNYSKKIFEKCGFEMLAEFQFEDYKVDGKVVFDSTGEHKSLKVYGKCLK
ncbi:arylalkylamine N-acetyltransferase 1-like [Mercenaria mercenaria]|uniref:arylalkylamine N-acetyltransferase 1-like n=1 Tax=Mercenaria mercenaria TaxID=6596 RepID=UPI00234EF8B2|nr:arylalkylamine N-acetyltransferase 1-like [Mercenaria mercenaria]